VTPEVRILVLQRDQHEMARVGLAVLTPTCVAPLIDPDAGPCAGRSTLDHLKEEPRMGVRATSVPEHLVSLCQGHTEDGMKAGHIWNTSHRPELREYLVRVNHRCTRCHALVIGPRCGFCGLPATSNEATEKGRRSSGH